MKERILRARKQTEEANGIQELIQAYMASAGQLFEFWPEEAVSRPQGERKTITRRRVGALGSTRKGESKKDIK